MTPTMKEFGIDQLSVPQKIRLAQEIWESVAPDLPPSLLTAEQCSELDRRDAELDADPKAAMTWEEIKASLRGGQ